MSSEAAIQARAREIGVTLMSVDDTYKELSRRMLAGCTLTDQSCPITNFPLKLVPLCPCRELTRSPDGSGCRE